MQAIELRTEYLKNPLGIDIKNPRLMWKCEGGKTQTAYKIIADIDGKTVWNSGKVNSNRMYAQYPHSLQSRQRVTWQVELWDENDTNESPSQQAFFETGLLQRTDWQAKWISGNYKVNKKNRYPVDCFKKIFFCKDVKKARLYITACGLYELSINDSKAGNFCLAPGHTDYTKRIQYQTIDVTALLKNGENIITAQLADGWYRGSCGAWGRRNQYGTQTKLLAQLEFTTTEGKTKTVITDETWLWSNDGEIRFADNKDGEIIDANMSPSYSAKAKLSKCEVIPVASNNYPVIEHERFESPKVIKTPKGQKVLDFSQNIAGYVEFKIKAFKGQKIKLRFGETFDEYGEFTQKNIQISTKKRTTPLQQIEYVCKDGVNIYKTKFAIFGFQYMLVESDADWSPEDFVAIAVYSDITPTMKFSCSNKLINQFVENTVWSAKNNHADVPTDCPTRERHGWTGDAQIFVNTASYLFDYDAFARKYLYDMADGQRKNGCFRQISPKGGIDFYMNTMDGSAGWSDAGVFIPYRLWKQYGDMRIISQYYPYMKKYAIFKIKTIGKWYLTALPTGIGLKYSRYISNYGQSYGEWAEPQDVMPFSIKDFICPHPEETTAYIVFMLERMTEIALALGKTDDAKLYKTKADKVRIGYQKLIETKKYSYDTDRQAKLVRPLYLNLLTDEQKKFAEQRLIKALDNYGWRLGTGFLSTPFILYVLQNINPEYAYRLLENEEMPGWLFMPKTGANTIWESWEGTFVKGAVASLNHYSKGAVCEWLFSRMCGINIAGENSFIITPCPGGKVKYANAEYDSVYGKIKCAWKKSEGKCVYEITVPSNTSAKIVLPKGTTQEVKAGTYTFEE